MSLGGALDNDGTRLTSKPDGDSFKVESFQTAFKNQSVGLLEIIEAQIWQLQRTKDSILNVRKSFQDKEYRLQEDNENNLSQGYAQEAVPLIDYSQYKQALEKIDRLQNELKGTYGLLEQHKQLTEELKAQFNKLNSSKQRHPIKK